MIIKSHISFTPQAAPSAERAIGELTPRKGASYEENETLAQRFVGQLYGRMFDALFEASEVMKEDGVSLFRSMLTDALGDAVAVSPAGQELVDSVVYQMLTLQEGKPPSLTSSTPQTAES
ncbi:MAG: hypothetical protein ACK5O7_01930 [Holosporales bacterium]